MFKLNNKGFAFSTILYGLMLMGTMVVLLIMSTMQTNRVTNKTFVDKIEQELNRFSLTKTEFTNLNDSQEYIVPEGQSGWYKIELWGAQGGGNQGGAGAYTSGLIWLNDNAHLYFYVGKQGQVFNGGGAGSGSGFRGGGATDVRFIQGNWDSADSLESRIMVAAGGGGAGDITAGGGGGTILGLNGSGDKGGAGAKQASGTFGKGNSASASNAGGGGGGYYGGEAGGAKSGGGGGSSYISGYAGVITKTSTGTVNDKSTMNDKVAKDYSNFTNGYFLNGLMIPNSRIGNGSAKIEKVSSNDKNTPPPSLNSKLYGQNITYVEDCVSGMRKGTDESIKNSAWAEIQVIQDGKNIAYNNSSYRNGKIDVNKSLTKKSGSSNQCVSISLSGTNNRISEIAVWHDFSDSENSFRNHYLRIRTSSGYVYLTEDSRNVNTLESNESSNGFHYSAWQPDSTTSNLLEGTYYIMSSASDNLFLTNKYVNGKEIPAEFTKFTGEANQKWNFKLVSNDNGHNYYQITSASDNGTLQIQTGSGIDNSPVGIEEFRGIYDWNMWRVEPAGNGFFYIKSPDKSEFNTNLAMDFNNKTLVSQIPITATAKEDVAFQNRLQHIRILSTSY